MKPGEHNNMAAETQKILRLISAEDIAFLKDLQHERLTQPNDGNADPVFWGVAEERTYPTDEDYSDRCEIFDGEITYSFEEAKKYALEEELATQEELDDIRDEDDFVELLNRGKYTGTWRVIFSLVEQSRVTDQTGCFLTKRACKKHIELNDYHYRKGHTYAMTAWRNPEFEHLMKIIEGIDFDAIQVKNE